MKGQFGVYFNKDNNTEHRAFPFAFYMIITTIYISFIQIQFFAAKQIVIINTKLYVELCKTIIVFKHSFHPHLTLMRTFHQYRPGPG